MLSRYCATDRLTGHVVALIAQEPRDCLNDDDTRGKKLPVVFYDDGRG
jgi:hypothetical protein